MTFDANTASLIADALNKHVTASGLAGRTDPLTGESVDRLDVTDRTPLQNVLPSGKHVKVIAPYITIETGTPDGRQIRGFGDGAVLPTDVPAGKVRHLLDAGLVVLAEGALADLVEGQPTQRHRVTAAAADGFGPVVGTPPPGSAAADFDADPVGAAQRSAGGGEPLTAGADDDARRQAEASGLDYAQGDDMPARNASQQEWADYAIAHGVPASEAKSAKRDDLRDRFM